MPPMMGIRNLSFNDKSQESWKSHNYCCQIKIERMAGDAIVASSKAIIATSNSSELTIREAHQ